MVLDNVPRIAAPPPDALFRDWILPRCPVIFTDLFEEAPLRRIDTLEKARHDLGDVELQIQPNYLSFLQTGERGAPRQMSLRDYLGHVADNPQTLDLCVEFPTPAKLRSLLPPPDVSELYAEDRVSATFVANAGNFNHLHFDDDQRHVLLYEVFGTKRFSVIPPEQGRKLDAFLLFDAGLRRAVSQVPARDANGRVYFQTFPSERAKDSFLAYLGASDCLLHPGETLFMPALAWHYVEYRDTSLSVTYRLGRSPLTRALCEIFPCPTVIQQSVCARLLDERRFEAEFPDLSSELHRTLFASTQAPEVRARAVADVVLNAFETFFGEPATAVLAARDAYRSMLSF